ncbi:alpha/beta fold hydrolase [Acinetobacter populi]|uniref:Alpha/beta hydrolase n=1 Tax=Acinetobacter populi TaxID=1582270 RepID=A0A1Z9YW39_9GAMM|nr:alpha/beta hydrolase [Acinetobacter populi]MCH4248316.1 alpha/beta hydrolase [Acinetobacter populi]OUY06417.1 alpha/beta hydrolase [Acinetobacter populi]
MMTLIEKLIHYPLKTVSLDGVQQGYREAGNGQYLVLLHGISSGSGSWINQLEQLSHHYHVVAWDAPGYGLSDCLDNPQPSAKDYAERLKGLLDVLGADQIILVGHSLGAMQASAFAHVYPERVKQLVIANVAQGYQRHSEEEKAAVFAKRPQLLAKLGAFGLAKARGPHMLYQHEPQALALITNVMEKLRLEGFTQASYLLAYDEIRNYLKDLKVPCVVIAAKQDEITPPENIRRLVQEMATQQFLQIKQAGHLSYLDQPEQFNQIILSAQSATL